MATSRFNLQHCNLQPSRTRAFIKVQDGCRNRCTFCIVTVARGDERSRAIAEVVAEVNALHAEGYQEAVLTGVHLGGYGSDLGAGLRELVAALLADTTSRGCGSRRWSRSICRPISSLCGRGRAAID